MLKMYALKQQSTPKKNGKYYLANGNFAEIILGYLPFTNLVKVTFSGAVSLI